MSVKQILKTFPVDIRKHIKKSKTRKDLYKQLNKKLPNKLQEKSFLIDQVVIKMLFINQNTFDIKTEKMIIPFNNNWYQHLLNDYHLNDIYYMTNDDTDIIKDLNREELSRLPYVYTFTNKPFDTIKIPNYFQNNKIKHVWNWFHSLIIDLKNKLIEYISKIDNQDDFMKLLNDLIIDKIKEILTNYFNNDENFNDQNTFHLKQFFDRYLHVYDEKSVINFYLFINMKFGFPLQCLLYYSKGRFLNFIHKIHVRNRENNLLFETHIDDMKLYWEDLLNEFFEYVFSTLNLNIMIHFIHYPSFEEYDLFNECKKICDKMSLDIYQNIPIIHENDNFSIFYDKIKIPIFYQWAIMNISIHPHHILKNHLKNNKPLTFRNINNKNNNNEKNHYTQLKMKNKKPIIQLTDKIKHNIVSHSEDGNLLYFKDDENNNYFMINPKTNEWYLYDDQNKEYTKQNTILHEEYNNNTRNFIEV